MKQVFIKISLYYIKIEVGMYGGYAKTWEYLQEIQLDQSSMDIMLFFLRSFQIQKNVNNVFNIFILYIHN